MPVLDAKTKIALKNILFATDFSDSSKHVLRYAEAIARRYGSKIYAAHVVPPEIYNLVPPVSVNYSSLDLVANAKTLLTEMAATIPARIPHEVVVREGPVSETLFEIIQDLNIDLVVLGTQGGEGFKKFMLGSAAEEIFRTAPCPVLTVGPCAANEPPSEGDIKRIVFATDFSKESLSAVPYAVSLAEEHNARLTVFHVAERATSTDKTISEVRDRLRRLIPEGVDLWCSPEFVVYFGAVRDAILNASLDRHADLIVLGVKRYGEFPEVASHLPAPLAYHVMAHAPCPVLTVKPPLEDRPPAHRPETGR